MDEILKKLNNFNFEFFFATNSISFSFIRRTKEEKEENFEIWIDPFWRFVKENKIILSSMTCPWHEDFGTNEEYGTAFDTWCKTVSYLKSTEIKIIRKKTLINDLLIEWSDGTILEVIQNDNEEESWYLNDNLEKKYYLAFPNKIVVENENE